MITLHQGDILTATTDYIVNPANSFLDHKGGLAQKIAEAAFAPFNANPLSQWDTGPDGSPVALIREARDRHNTRVMQWIEDHEAAPLIATGNAHITSPGALPYEGVIHAVGPVWNGGKFMEGDLLEMAYESAFDRVAAGRSVAVPAISAGVFGMPIDTAARIAVATAEWYDQDIDIQFWLYSDAHLAAFQRQLEAP